MPDEVSRWTGEVYLAPSGEWAFKYFQDGEEMGGGAGFESENEARLACDEILSGREEPKPIVEQWRQIALDFHAIRGYVAQKNLPGDFEPGDLANLLERGGLSPAVAGIMRFLLHIYNSENPFDLAETQRWDRDHIQAFVRWTSGSAGELCRYF